MHPILYLILTIIEIYSFIVLLAVIFSLLLQFRVLNLSNQFVYRVNEILEKLTEPVLRRIRDKLPDVGGIDLSPLVLLVALHLLSYSLRYYFA